MSKKKALTRTQALARIRRIANPWAQFLGVSQTWRLQLVLVDELPDGGAQMKHNPNYHDAKIEFEYKSFNTCPESEVEFFVLHELLHLVFAGLSDSLKGALGEASVFANAYKPEEERLIDTLARYLIAR